MEDISIPYKLKIPSSADCIVITETEFWAQISAAQV